MSFRASRCQASKQKDLTSKQFSRFLRYFYNLIISSKEDLDESESPVFYILSSTLRLTYTILKIKATTEK